MVGKCVVGFLVIVSNCFASEKIDGFRDGLGRTLTGTTRIIDPIDGYQKLSQRSQFNESCELLSKQDNLDHIIGARLLIKAALEGKNSDALERLRFECKIANDKDSEYISRHYTIEELINLVVARANEHKNEELL
jgi:hypothetical protein